MTQTRLFESSVKHHVTMRTVRHTSSVFLGDCYTPTEIHRNRKRLKSTPSKQFAGYPLLKLPTWNWNSGTEESTIFKQLQDGFLAKKMFGYYQRPEYLPQRVAVQSWRPQKPIPSSRKCHTFQPAPSGATRKGSFLKWLLIKFCSMSMVFR